MADQELEEVLKRRDGFQLGSQDWNSLNEEKAEYLESIKPSTRERIIYFNESDLGDIMETFTADADISNLPFGVERRSLLEYHPAQRHPIPYALIRFEDEYFFILREQGGGELRLIGKKGLVGGHVAEEDIVAGNLEATIHRALLREVREEAGTDETMIKSVELRGIIKSDVGVDIDHLGMVYEIEINTREIRSAEEDVLTGMWISREELPQHYESLENWSKIVYDNLLRRE